MEKVYVIVISDVYDMTENSHSPIVFKNREDAIRRFNDIVEAFESEYAYDIEDGWEIEKNETSYSAWEEGRYVENHYDVTVYELEVL